MKTDRELLELAAKSIGHDLIYDETFGLFGYYDEESDFQIFDPLDDDGVALRLAAKLGMCINFEYGIIECPSTYHFAIGDIGSARRAIVRAAAQIGEKMK